MHGARRCRGRRSSRGPASRARRSADRLRRRELRHQVGEAHAGPVHDDRPAFDAAQLGDHLRGAASALMSSSVSDTGDAAPSMRRRQASRSTGASRPMPPLTRAAREARRSEVGLRRALAEVRFARALVDLRARGAAATARRRSRGREREPLPAAQPRRGGAAGHEAAARAASQLGVEVSSLRRAQVRRQLRLGSRRRCFGDCASAARALGSPARRSFDHL